MPTRADDEEMRRRQAAQRVNDYQRPAWMRDAPNAPYYSTLRDNTGLLSPQYQTTSLASLPGLEGRLQDLNLDTRGLEAFRNEALRTGPSAWATLATQRQGLEEANARDVAASQAQRSAAQARSQMATRGGLTGGAGERLARSSGLDLMRAGQDVARQGQAARMDIGLSDEQKRMQALGQLPGMEVQALQPEMQKTQMWGQAQQWDLGNQMKNQQFNIEQALNEKRQADAAGMQNYQEQMKAWAANRQAQATERSGK